ncbi:MAG: T9SS C-terminal target domain-containing protein [Calditrichaeota bacterium]|nr:MAG: T9SS C-terminal target domain-containing protein [Calditrichota bacterium]
MNKYPTNGATISLTIPQYGLEMSSSNDGPIDQNVTPVDTIPILTDEKVAIEVVQLPSRDLTPGVESGPLLNLLFSNLYSMNIGVDSIQFDYIGNDPDGASQNLQSSQFSSINLYLQRDRNTDGISSEDTLIAEGVLVNGQIVFSTSGLTLNKNGGNTVLTVTADLDMNNSKNGNTVAFQLSDSALIYVDQPVIFNTTFPLLNQDAFTINSFPANAVTLHTVSGTTIFGGQNRKLVLDFELPANGYEDDTLKSIRIQNIGSQSDSEAVASLDLWYDIDDNGFTLNDLKLGTFTENTSYWEINHIDHYIPVGGKRYFVTTDIYNTNFSGGTLQYEIIQGGCTYSSGMTGPDDAPLENPEEHVVFPSNRITAISLPASEEIILPGGPEKTMLSFALYNGYTDRDQILNSIGLTNISKTLSSPDYSDYELGSISLYYDTDNSGTLNETTPVANGRFINNKLNLSGLNITLPKEELSYFFVVSDFPNSLIDSDSLAISIAAPSDFGFVENVNINGALPLSRGSYLIVDGSSKAQYTIYPVSPKTLSPGDMQVSLFAFSPAINGDLGDRLDSLRIENTGTADNTDITALHLWLDLNNDSLWQDTDSMLTSLTYSSGAWEAGNLNLQFNTLSPILFVTGDISASATPDRTFNTRIPLNGFEYLSENDGPRDLPIIDVNTFTISGSNLRVEIAQMKPTYSVGETISISLKATNLSPSPLTNMICNIISISDSQAVSLESSNIGPIDLNAGENYDFTYHYTADSASLLNWQFQVVAVDINDSSAIVISPLIQIQNTPVDIPLVLINSMPTAVTKGQSNVFPLSLTISHPDSLPTSAPIRLDSLFLSIEDASGQSQLASALFSRVVLTAGYDILSVLETIPNLSTVPMYFDDPLVINVNEQKNLTLLIDIDSAATALDMVLSINTGSDIPLTDYNNNQSLTIDPSVVFPLKTASCRIDNPSNIMEIAFKPTLKPNANYGQENVNLIGFEISHPGGQSSSQIQLTSLSFELFDESDNLIIINDIFNRIKVRKQFSIVADISDNLDSSSVQIQLASPITLNPGERDSLYILADINNLSTVSGFKLQIADSTSFVVRDLSSGSLITVTADTNSLVTSSLFPITTSTATLKLSAESPEICFQSVLSPSVIRGKDSLDLINLSIDYPYSTAYSPVVLQSMLLYCLDSLERPIDPISLFDRIGYKVNNSLTINYQPFIQLLSGAILFNFETDSIILAAGDSLDLIIVGDIEADAPYDHFRLMISEPQSFELNDQTDTTYMPLVAFDANCSQSYPLQTSIATIISPAGRPGVNAESSEVTAIYAGQQDVVLFSTALHYDQQSHQGDLLFSSLQGYLKKRTQSGYSSYNGVQIFDNVRLLIDGIPYAADSVLADDLLELQADSGVVISNGESAEISIVADINQNAQMGNYRLEFLDSTFIDIEDLQLATNVYPILLSGSYPVLSTELSLASANLKESFSNYPNPFTDETTITFVMEENGRVDIELYTITGKSVLTLVDDEYRSAGVYNSDKWYGKNAEDLPVVAGTYFCRITVRYDSQKEESELRKISVIR